MSFFSNRKKDIETATKEAVATGDTSKLDKLLKHTIAETGGGSLEEHEENLLRALKGE